MFTLLKNKLTKIDRELPPNLAWTKIDPRNLLYISDLDGTLLSSSGSLSTERIQRLNHLIDRGLRLPRVITIPLIPFSKDSI
jgi:hypothetical protein